MDKTAEHDRPSVTQTRDKRARALEFCRRLGTKGKKLHGTPPGIHRSGLHTHNTHAHTPNPVSTKTLYRYPCFASPGAFGGVVVALLPGMMENFPPPFHRRIFLSLQLLSRRSSCRIASSQKSSTATRRRIRNLKTVGVVENREHCSGWEIQARRSVLRLEIRRHFPLFPGLLALRKRETSLGCPICGGRGEGVCLCGKKPGRKECARVSLFPLYFFLLSLFHGGSLAFWTFFVRGEILHVLHVWIVTTSDICWFCVVFVFLPLTLVSVIELVVVLSASSTVFCMFSFSLLFEILSVFFMPW